MVGFFSTQASEYSENKDPTSPSFQKLSQGKTSKSQSNLDRNSSYIGSVASVINLISL